MKITSFALLILVASMVAGGMTSSASAQDDPEILLKIAKNAQDQIRQNISNNSSSEVMRFFQEGSNQVDALSKALENKDVESAKKHFLSAMEKFKEISRMLTSEIPRNEIAASRTQIHDPTSDLLKLYKYSSSLKAIAERYHTSIDFTELNNLFATAREQITSQQLDDAQATIHKIKQILDDITKQLRDQASQQESERAKQYAQMYLEQLDRLIESAKNQGISEEIIKMLEDAREKLSSASNPEDILKEVRKIISLKDQFELTKNDRLESRIMQVEKTLQRLSQMDRADPQIIKDAREELQKIKSLLSDGDFEQANELLRSLADLLNKIIQS
jgi:hypothetical protein